MSSTPPDDSPDESYEAGWRALNKLMRRGFSWSGHERHCAFWQGPDGRFRDVSGLTGLDYPDDGRAAAVVDWDLDGDQDLVVTSRTGPRVRVLANETQATNGFLALSPRGRRSNPDAVGARVELELASGKRLVRSVRAGEGYLAQSSAWLHFGLGEVAPGDEPLRAIVTWPGGGRQAFEGLVPRRFYALEEGVDAPRELDLPRIVLDEGAATAPLEHDATKRVVMLTPVPVPGLPVVVDGDERRLCGVRPGAEPEGPPLLVVLTASWCPPCRAELETIAGAAGELGAHGMNVVALSLDDEQERSHARARLEELGWPFPVAFAKPGAIAILDALQGILRDDEAPLVLPTSLLLDGAGRLIVLYEGAVDPARVVLDQELSGAPPAARRDAAAFSRGLWAGPPEEPDPAFLEARFAARGLADAARELARERLSILRSSPASLYHDFGLRAGAERHLEEAIGHFRRALREDPDQPSWWRDLGIALHRIGRPAQAVDAYRQALRLAEDDTTRYDLGLAYLASGDRQAARVELERLRAAGSPRAEELQKAYARLDGAR